MRYLDFSAKKVLPFFFVVAMLFGATFYTFAVKGTVYGTAPFFSAVQLFGEEKAIYALFALRHLGSQTAAALSMFSSKESAAAGPAKAVPVLTYHRINVTDDSANVTIRNFMDQMETLYRDGWRTVTLDEYSAFMRKERELPQKSFLITFDDGTQRSFYPTDPILKLLGFTAIQYVIVAASEAEGSSYYLSDEQLRYVLSTRRWEIGSHSYDAHRPYPVDAQGGTGIFYSDKLWLPEQGRLETSEEFRARVRDDLRSSREALESTYGLLVSTFAFPFGGEAGISGAKNFPEGESVSIEEASKVYDIGWVQSERKEYTFNYPGFRDFLHERIHVDYDWDGERLLEVMRGGIPKELPFTDTMEKDSGWLQSWGEVSAGGQLVLRAPPGQTSASSILDGTRLWENYDMEAVATWQGGTAFLLGSATSARTYCDCAFSQGEVLIHSTREGSTSILARASDGRVQHGTGVRLGIRVDGDVVSCLYNGVVVLEAQGMPLRQGGVGLQVWDRNPGAAELFINTVSVVER